MVVTKKIEKNESIGDIEAYLSKGGQVQADMTEQEKDAEIELWKTICLRIPHQMLEHVDKRVKRRAALSRTAWILEAIQQKLTAEGEYDYTRSERD